MPVSAWGQTSSDAVKQVAGKILAQAAPHSNVSISFENRSSLEAGDAGAMKASLEQQLRAGGLELSESDTKLRVTLSEDPARYLLVAQLGPDVAMSSWGKPPRPAVEYRIALKRTPVWEQRDPILDVKMSNGGSSMTVLEPGRVVQYTKKDNAWQMDHATNAAPSLPATRDPRGRFDPDAADRWVAGRNYMDGGERGFYFTRADTGGGTLLAGIDGHTRFYGQRPEPLLVINNWGSDLAAIESNCGAKKQVLATSAASDESQDHLQAFEYSTGSFSPASEALPLPGPVTALWPAETPDQVTLVIHNRQTGVYEASRVSLACAQ